MNSLSLSTLKADYSTQAAEMYKEIEEYLSEDGFLPDGAPEAIQQKYNRWVALEDVNEALDNLETLIDAIPVVSQ